MAAHLEAFLPSDKHTTDLLPKVASDLLTIQAGWAGPPLFGVGALPKGFGMIYAGRDHERRVPIHEAAVPNFLRMPSCPRSMRLLCFGRRISFEQSFNLTVRL